MRFALAILLLMSVLTLGMAARIDPDVEARFQARLEAAVRAAVVDASKTVHQQGNNNKVTDTDPWTMGIAIGGVVAVVGITYGIGHVHGGRRRRIKALCGKRS